MQYLIIITIILLLLLYWFLSNFNVNKKLFLPLAAIILMFSAGFGLRLTGNPYFIDRGYFLTEISHLFASMMFASALILGQAKYWGKQT